jgi:hypothetical protein
LAASHPASAARIRHPVAIFAGLDKITGRTIAFEAAAGETVQFGTLQITERACFTHPATETPQTTTFVEVDEVLPDKQYKRIFSGWMFAASPGLHGIEHPIYDIWLTGCGGEGVAEAGAEAAQGAESAGPPPASEPAQPSGNAAPPAPAPAQMREQKHPRPSRRNELSESPSAPPGDAGTSNPPGPELGADTPSLGEVPRQQPGAEAPPLGQPIEVGPPPGLIPAPREGRRAPVQRYYPADPDTAPDPSAGGGLD